MKISKFLHEVIISLHKCSTKGVNDNLIEFVHNFLIEKPKENSTGLLSLAFIVIDLHV